MPENSKESPASAHSETNPTSKEGVGSRACAREDATEGERTSILANFAEIEAVAAAIERGVPEPRETIAKIIASEPRIRRMVVAASVRALGATRWWYDSKRKRRIVEPDFALSFRAAEFLADRVDGRPAQALLTMNVQGPGENRKTEEILADSPAAMEAAVRAVEAAKRLVRKRQEIRALPAEREEAASPAR